MNRWRGQPQLLISRVEMRLAALQRHRPVRVLVRLFRKIGVDDAAGVAAEMSFRFFFALFPFLLFLVAALGYLEGLLGLQDLSAKVIGSLETVLPQAIMAQVGSVITLVLTTQSPTLLTSGMLVTLWSAAGGVNVFIKGLNRAYGDTRPRPFWRVRLLALVFTAVLPLMLVLAALAYIFGGHIGRGIAGILGYGALFERLWGLTRWPFILLSLFLGLAMAYYILPAIPRRFLAVLPGTALAIGAWLLVTGSFGLYLANFGDYGFTYGSLAPLILMLWMYMISLILLVGAELNVVLAQEFSWLAGGPRGAEQAAVGSGEESDNHSP